VEEGYEVESRIEPPEEGHPTWLIGVIAVTTAVLAVLAVYSSQLAGQAAHRALTDLNEAAILQSQASDQWNFYQAEGIKRHIFETQRDALRLGGSAGGVTLAATYDKQAKRYQSQQAQIRREAERLEHERDQMKAAAQQFETRNLRLALAVAGFQVGIVLCSVAAIIRRAPLWYLGLVAGGFGILVLIQVFLSSAPPAHAG